VLELVQKYEVEDRVLLSSFRHDYLRLIKAKMPQIPTAALVEGAHPQNLFTYLQELQVEVYNLDDLLVDGQTVKMLRDKGFFVGVYTINSASRRDELFAMGVNAIFTDTLYKENKS
jgi:glycerophosphoryl diester phosphodiesterase